MTSPAAGGIRDSSVLVVVGVLGAYLLVGVLAGAVWEWVWTPPTQVIKDHHVFYTDYSSLRRVFTGTGLYVLVSAVASALTALGVALLTRRRELLVLGLVVVGSWGAAWVMHRVGTALGPTDPATVAAHAPDGPVSGPLQVQGTSPYVVWPMMSLFVLALAFFSWPGRGPRRAGRGADTGHDTGPETGPEGPETGHGAGPAEVTANEPAPG
jgi:hypothetical protein